LKVDAVEALSELARQSNLHSIPICKIFTVKCLSSTGIALRIRYGSGGALSIRLS
jgi:hypothetical protein